MEFNSSTVFSYLRIDFFICFLYFSTLTTLRKAPNPHCWHWCKYTCCLPSCSAKRPQTQPVKKKGCDVMEPICVINKYWRKQSQAVNGVWASEAFVSVCSEVVLVIRTFPKHSASVFLLVSCAHLQGQCLYRNRKYVPNVTESEEKSECLLRGLFNNPEPADHSRLRKPNQITATLFCHFSSLTLKNRPFVPEYSQYTYNAPLCHVWVTQ